MSLGTYNGTITSNGQGLASGLINGVSTGVQNNYDSTTQIVRNGLHLYWDLGNRRSYPGSGTTLFDLGPNAYNATLTATLDYIPLAGGCLLFDGTNELASTTSTTLGSATGAFTFGAWFRTRLKDGTKEMNAIVRGRNGSGNGYSVIIGTDVNGTIRAQTVTISPFTVGNTLGSPFVADVNKWYHVMGVWNPTVGAANQGLSLYINGQLAAYQLFTGTNLRSSTLGWILGTNSTVSTSLADGNIAVGYVYTRVLSNAEITQNFNAHKKRFGF